MPCYLLLLPDSVRVYLPILTSYKVSEYYTSSATSSVSRTEHEWLFFVMVEI